MATLGRPIKPIDVNILKQLAEIHCTHLEMAKVLGCSRDLLEKKYGDILEEGKQCGKASLRRAMWKAGVENGNTAMLIFMAKNLLGMTDRPILDDQDIRKYSIDEIKRISTRALEYLATHRKEDGYSTECITAETNKG